MQPFPETLSDREFRQMFFSTPAGREIVQQVESKSRQEHGALISEVDAAKKEAATVLAKTAGQFEKARSEADAAKKVYTDAVDAMNRIERARRDATHLAERRVAEAMRRLHEIADDRIPAFRRELMTLLERCRETAVVYQYERRRSFERGDHQAAIAHNEPSLRARVEYLSEAIQNHDRLLTVPLDRLDQEIQAIRACIPEIVMTPIE